MTVLKVFLLSKLILLTSGYSSILEGKYGETLIHFESFVSNFNKTYENPSEKMKRFNIFYENIEKIKELNEKDPLATYAVNEFADLASEEFLEHYTGARPDLDYEGCTQVTSPRGNNAPDELDWSSQGVVSPAKMQGYHCGSCWAFSVTGVVESRYAKMYNVIVDLSEQQLLDCDTDAHACKGGYPPTGFNSLMQIGGQVSEADYPYEAQQGSCRFDASKVVVRLTQCQIYSMSEENLKQVVFEDGPISAIMVAENLQNYQGSVFEAQCTTNLTFLHAVVIIGYGTENDTPYWLIKNSWGPTWGNQGNFKLKRGTNACLIGTLGYQSGAEITRSSL